MNNLEDIWNAKTTRLESPLVKFDWKTEHLRFRLGTDMGQLKLLVRHYVDGIGYVKCNQDPAKKKDGTLGIFGTCHFCAEKKAYVEQIKAQALAEGRQLTKEETEKTQKFNKRYIQLIGKAEVEVRQGKKVVKPLAQKAMSFKASDMFFDQLNQAYKILSSIYEMRGSLVQHWFTMDGKGQILIDRECTPEELEIPVEVDLSYFDNQTKSYEETVEKIAKRSKAAEEAIPLGEEDEEVPY